MALQNAPLTPSPANTSTPVLGMTKPPARKGPSLKARLSSAPFWVGLTVSVSWVGIVLAVVAKSGPGESLAGVPLVDWAIGISAAVSPVAMVWMITAYLQRAADIQSIAEPLRRQLTLITGESGAADARIRRFNQALREQIELLRSAQSLSQDDLEAVLDRVRQHRGELERFDHISTKQVADIQDIIRRSMFQMEQMMDDKFTMLRVLDGKLQKNGDGVARQVDGVGEQIAKMLEEIEHVSGRVADALDRAQRDSKKLADSSHLQEASLTNAATAAAETLGGLSSKIDMSVARFLERASTAREEAERLAHTLDAQTRALDDFSNTLPVRVSEAEAVLRGVADRLYASEEMARDQAVRLSEKLSQQVDGLHSFMEKFTTRLADIDNGLDRRQTDLNALGERIGATTSGFISSWENSLTSLNDRTGNTLLRFNVINDETRRNAETVAAHLGETTSKYEDVVIRMRNLSAESGEKMKEMTADIASQLSHFESLSQASNKAGEEVQARAATALQNLQHVLERVLAAREATQSVGQTLVKDIYDVVDQNEKMIQRLHEAAQMGAKAIGAAAETLSRQEIEVVGKAKAGEAVLVESMQKMQKQAEISSAGLREQTSGLMNLLAETQGQLVATDQKLQRFAAQAVDPVQKAVKLIDASAEQGLRGLNGYGEGLNAQVARLQEFHTRIGGMGQEMGKTTAETAATFEALNARLTMARATQEESVRQTLTQFADLSDRMQREISGLDGQAATAAELLQQAALKVGEQSYEMLEKARSSGAQIKDVTTALQAEAAQIQSILRQQTEEINSDLVRAEQKFASLGETIRERADHAYEMLDRTIAHYGEAAQKLEVTVAVSQDKVDGLNAVLAHQVDQINNDAAKIKTHSDDIAASSGRAVQNLSLLNDKLAGTHDTSVSYATQTLVKLDETAAQFHRQAGELRDAAQNATESVAKAGSAFGEQTGKLIDSSHQIDGALRQITQATSLLTEQAAQVRVGMEQQSQRLLSQLTDAVAQLDVTGGKLQQIVTVATQGADQASTRFADMTETASKRINTTTQELFTVAERTESTLAALGANVTQQAASLSVVGEQIGEQQKLLAAANETQRAQMVDLFDKLGNAHKQASEIAERSIAYLTTSLQEIHRQMGLVGDQSQVAVGNVKMASIGFSEQSASLLQNAQAAEQQARAVLSVTSALQEQARHLRESLQSESERAGESLGALLSRLTIGGTEIRDLGTNTNIVLTALHRSITDQSNELGGSLQQIGERQRNLTAALDQQREAINALLNRLTLAQDETAATAENAAVRLIDGAQQITRNAETLETRSQSALANVQAAAAGFAREAEGIDTQSRQIEGQARTILASATGMHSQINDLRTSLQTEGERTNTVLGTLLNKVTSGAAEIRDMSAATEMSLISLGNNVEQQSAALTTSMQQIAERQRSLAIALDSQRDVVNGLLNRLTLAQDETAAAADRAVTRLADGSQQITRHIESIDGRAHSALVTVQAATDAFIKEAAAIDAQTKQAEQQAQAIVTAASGLHGKIYDLRSSMQNDGERATEVLGGLLNRITLGGNEVREAGAAAEATMTVLQRVMGEQAGELSTSMKEVSERQRTLTAGLEQQRETINALLNRFILAQDETAAAADRAAERITDGAGKIAQSIDQIGAQASTTMVSVQASVSGFAEQAEILNQQGQRAEQQMRGVLSVTTGMQEQACQLREAMQSETAAVVEQLAAIIKHLDETGRQLKSQSSDAVAVLEQTSQRFAATSEVGTDALRKQSDLLAQTADQSEARLTNASEKIRSHLRLVGEVGDQTEMQARQLADTAEHATLRLVGLRDTLNLNEKDGRSIVEAATQRIEEVKAALQAQMYQLSEGAQKAVNDVAGASQNLATQSDALRANLAMSESALSEAANLVREEAKQLPATLSRGVADVEIAAKALKVQTSDADQALIGTADRFITVTSTARDTMTLEMQRVSTIAAEAGKVLGHFNQIMVEQVATMQQSASMLSGEQKELVEKADRSIAALTSASEKLAALRGQASQTAERMAHDFDLLDKRAAATGDRLAQAGEGISKQAAAITQATERAEGQMSLASNSMREQLERIRNGLQAQIDDINRGLMQITAQLERTGASLRSTAVGAVADVERVGQRFEQTGGEAAAQVTARTEQMRQATEDVSMMLSSFGTQFDQMLQHMAAAGDGIKHHEGDMVNQLQTMLSHLGTVAAKLEAARTLSGDVSQHAIERLDEVVNAVQIQMNALSTDAQKATGIMRGIGQIYSDQTGALTKGVTEAHTQVLTMNKSIDDMQQRTDRMRSSLKMQGEDLMSSLRQILVQLEMTGDGLSDAVNRTLQQQAAKKII